MVLRIPTLDAIDMKQSVNESSFFRNAQTLMEWQAWAVHRPLVLYYQWCIEQGQPLKKTLVNQRPLQEFLGSSLEAISCGKRNHNFDDNLNQRYIVKLFPCLMTYILHTTPTLHTLQPTLTIVYHSCPLMAPSSTMSKSSSPFESSRRPFSLAKCRIQIK